MTTTLNDDVQRRGAILNTTICMTTKMHNVDNNERQQRVLLQRGGSILNTTISMTTNINHDNEDVTTATKTKTTMAMNEDNDEETNSKDNNDLIF